MGCGGSRSTPVVDFDDDEFDEFTFVTEVRPGRRCGLIHLPKDSARTTLFFVHGVAGCALQWRKQLAFFHKRFAVVAIDLFGHGKSDAPLSSKKERLYCFEELARDVLAIVSQFQNTNNYGSNVLIGHSYGTSFTVYVADAAPSMVAKIVNISGGDSTDLEPANIMVPASVLSCTQGVLVHEARKKVFDPMTSPRTRSIPFKVPMHVNKEVMAGMDWSAGEQAHKNITHSVLLITGANDSFSTEQDMRVMRHTLLNSSYKMVPNASHMVMIEMAEKVNNLVLDFICDAEDEATQYRRQTRTRMPSAPIPRLSIQENTPTPMFSPSSPISSKPFSPMESPASAAVREFPNSTRTTAAGLAATNRSDGSAALQGRQRSHSLGHIPVYVDPKPGPLTFAGAAEAVIALHRFRSV